MTLELDMYMLMVFGIIALLLGSFLNSKIGFLRRICIPSPVTGGIVVSILTLTLYIIYGIQLHFDSTLKDICMLMFFTSVGFQSNLSVFKSGGKRLAVMIGLVAVLIVLQNLVGVSLASAMDLSPLLGLASGSITMAGGHGTAAGFTTLLEENGLEGAGTILMAAATFGLLAGSLMGGPLGGHIIEKRHLFKEDERAQDAAISTAPADEALSFNDYSKAVFEIFIAIGLGSLLSKALALSGLSFPTYFGSLIAAAIIRNIAEVVPGNRRLSVGGIISIGNISLSLFLGMAMVSLRLWELSSVALPLLVILLAQVVLIALFARFVAFPLLGRDYDAAMLVGGLCGFGLGATPNAMANMTAISTKYRFSRIPFIIVPIVGAMFLDIINVLIVTAFLH